MLSRIPRQDRIRALHHALIKQVCGVHPTNRVVEVLVVHLGSKNTRTRVVACEVVGELIEAGGIAVCQGVRHKPLPAIAQARRRPPPWRP
jgi:hypothetical protein